MYTIIEDCSPFYIRFTHPGISDIIDLCNNCIPEITKGFTHHRLSDNDSQSLLELLPMSQQLSLMKHRMSLFVTAPGTYYRAHKDGIDHRFSINYTATVLDNLCVTNWYDNAELKEYAIDNLVSNNSRECNGFQKEKHTPIKTMIAQPNEAILFNTDIFHDWDNTCSPNIRVVLTLRVNNPGTMYFEDAKKILFNSTDRSQH